MELRSDRPSFLSPRNIVLIGLVVAAALSRLLPHPPNFSPVEACALFAGAYFADRRLAMLMPLAAMFLSDLVLGFHSTLPVVYGCMALIAWFGHGLAGKVKPLRVAAYGLASAVSFFIVTNFAVWATSGMYPMTGAGLLECYVLAIPFFRNSLAGVAVYSIALFGGFALLARSVPGLQAARA